MKNNRLVALICISILSIVLAGCRTPADNEKSKTPAGYAEKFVPDDISDNELSALPAVQKAEVEELYGCYWNNKKDNCIKIGENGLISYSTVMSFSYTNVRWAKNSDTWICFSYHADNYDYTQDGRRVVLKFVKDTDGIKLWQYVVPMKQKSGSFIKGKMVEEIIEGGKKDYLYNKSDSSAPKMLEPKSI